MLSVHDGPSLPLTLMPTPQKAECTDYGKRWYTRGVIPGSVLPRSQIANGIAAVIVSAVSQYSSIVVVSVKF